MSGIDPDRTFRALNLAILTVSDTRDLGTDDSGRCLVERAEAAGHTVSARTVVRDELHAIRAVVRQWVACDDIDAIVSTGGTGLTGRDVTPESIEPLFDKTIDGFNAVFHRVSFESVGLSTLLSRACAGVIGATLVFCLPGSRGAVTDGWDKVIEPLLDSRHRPCNLAGILPRLAETAP